MSETPRTVSWRGQGSRSVFGFGALNIGLMAIAALAIVGGYVLLADGSITAAPLLLTLGYVVLVPLTLLAGYRRLRDDDQPSSDED